MRNDVSFPFDFFVAAPNIATVGSSFTIQVRATDTGGNAALSNVLTVDLVEDTFAPTITGFVPPMSASVVEPIQVVQVPFSEPMAGTLITSATIRVLDANDNLLTPTTFQLHDDDRLVQLTFPALLTGTYRIEVSRSVTDRAGNALGSDVTSPFTVTPRASLTTTSADADPGTPGLQVYEGTTIPLTVTVAPGVSVQKLELLVNGQIFDNDTTAPYQFSAIAPNIALGTSTLTLQAKVTDTAGLATFTSPPLLVGLLEDITAPTIANFEPASGGTAYEGLQVLKVNFTEPLAVGSVNAANFQLFEAGADEALGTGDDVTVSITDMEFANDDKQVRLATASLPIGNYRLRVVQDGVTDRAGNTLGTGPVESDFELLEQVLVNGGFEDNYTTGWTVQQPSLAKIVGSYAGDRFYMPGEGLYFSLLKTGSMSVYTSRLHSSSRREQATPSRVGHSSTRPTTCRSAIMGTSGSSLARLSSRLPSAPASRQWGVSAQQLGLLGSTRLPRRPLTRFRPEWPTAVTAW